ncbi:MAG TPA: methylenetetrahydrofolate--tRNA-(uracil(54)-C(5))-methyltransferase (FADH(2)-oxidizing) TrmFO, partial [Candidatus Lambdaproteobacteria bacterium]|nr:methylenetetrahydrofolate--tRNA-(uracil(54)-C(5))-methyltransferase (FADH(2)-oxidizing) TrmFO [Candidatus Lambdaproteobacteria bacterium]
QDILGAQYLSFYDAIAPVITAESIDMEIAFRASRYGKGEADYLNCPMHHEQYQTFITAVQEAEKVELHQFEDTRPFEGCLPIEVMVERGPDTLRFGPMKPVGLEHPETGERFHAVVQLRQENSVGSLYNLVGFQTKMTWTAQKEVFALIPGLANAEFVRLGSVHRNTFINGPALLNPQLNLKSHPNVFFAGQITGVEGYMESTAMGILAARQIAASLENRVESPPSPDTMMGALIRYITETDPSIFQPMNANFGLLDPPEKKMSKADRKKWYAERALHKAAEYANQV